MTDRKTEMVGENLTVLANAIELGAAVVMQIAGNDIANTIEGKLVTPDELRDALAAKIRSRYNAHLGAGV